MIRKLIVFFLVFSFSLFANSQALPSRIGAEVSAVVKTKVASRGFAVNDPRFGATVTAVGGAIVQIATGVVITGTAPAWGTVLATVVVAGAVGYAVQALANWMFNPDGTVTHTPPTGPIFVPGQGQQWVWNESVNKGFPLLDDGKQGLGSMEFCQSRFKGDPQWTVLSSSGFACFTKFTGPPWGDPNAPATRWSIYSLGAVGTKPDPTYQPPGSGDEPSTKPASEALQALSPDEKAKPLPAKVIADLANAAFKQAASQPGYAGVPYSMSDPITESDVLAFRAANPSFQTATVGDLAANIPLSDPLGQVSSNPSTGSPVNPAASSPLTNLGSDPGIGSPNLESTPTGIQILQPLSGLMPDLRNFQVPAHQALCPKPTFEILGKSIVMDGQCTILEGVRGELYNAMVLVFLLIALFIVLSA